MGKQRVRKGLLRTAAFYALVVAVCVAVLIATLAISGRRSRRPVASDNPDQAQALAPEALPGLTAERLLREATRAYANAKYYSDEAYAEIVYERDDDRRQASSRFACSLSFARPNFVRMEFGRALLRSDGKTLRAEILDDAFAGQVVEKPAPLLLTSIREFYPDAEFAAAANLGLPTEVFWTSPQLALLFSRDPFRTLAPREARLKLLDPAYLSFDGIDAESVLCDRVEVVYDGIARVYWFSRATRALARCELSPERIVAPEPNVRTLAARVEFPRQTLLQSTPDDLSEFQFGAEETPEVSRRVARFETPEIAALDRRFPVEAMRKLDGDESETPLLKEGVPTALCFWKTTDDDRDETLRAFATLAEENPTSMFLAVDCDASDVSDAEVLADCVAAAPTLTRARLDGAALMRLAPDAPPLSAPALALIDDSGATALFLFHSRDVERLRFALRELAEGRDPRVVERNASYENARRFERFMESATTNELYRTSLDVAKSDPPPRMMTKTTRLHEVWRYEGLFAPVNPLALSSRRRDASESDGAWETVEQRNDRSAAFPEDILIVPCDGNAIAVFSSRGKLLLKTTPAAAAGEPITFVRAVEFGQGRRYFVASASGASGKLHRFDERFNDLGSLEVGTESARRVGDARLADVDGDGVPELFFGIVSAPGASFLAQNGVYAVDMETRRVLWKDENVLAPTQVAIGERREGSFHSATLWTLDFTKVAQGSVGAYDARSGEPRDAIRVKNGETLRQIATTSRVGDDGARLVAVCVDESAEATYFVGFDSDGNELWRNVIPSSNEEFVERVKSGDVDGDGIDEWILVSGNGTIRFFSSAGVETDVFQYGATITGACLARWGGISYLIVTELGRTSAWRIDRNRR